MFHIASVLVPTERDFAAPKRLALLGPPFRFGGKLLTIWVLCLHLCGAPVLKRELNKPFFLLVTTPIPRCTYIYIYMCVYIPGILDPAFRLSLSLLSSSLIIAPRPVSFWRQTTLRIWVICPHQQGGAWIIYTINIWEEMTDPHRGRGDGAWMRVRIF